MGRKGTHRFQDTDNTPQQEEKAIRWEKGALSL